MDNSKELTHISLCAGYGGIDLGLKRVLPNLRTVAFSEIEAYAVANLVAKMEAGLLDAAPVWTDLKTFPWESFRGKVDILSGGFPCQPFSAAGRRRGDEDPRHLFPHIKRGIALLRPSIVFLENVEGIISSKLGEGWSDRAETSVLLHVLRELERLGYETEAGIFSARECGAPHQRKRVFIMGISKGSNGKSSIRGGRSIKESISLQIRESSFNVLSFDGRNELGELSRRINSDVFPSRRGEPQKEWEPKRVTLGDSKCKSGENSDIERECIKQKNLRQKTRVFTDANIQGKTQGRLETRKSFMDNSRHTRLQKCKDEQKDSRSQRQKRKTRQLTKASPSRNISRQIKSSMGRDTNGSSNWMDYGDLCESVCNRTDELRLLGNGVVPSTAERAFRVLWKEIEHE